MHHCRGIAWVRFPGPVHGEAEREEESKDDGAGNHENDDLDDLKMAIDKDRFFSQVKVALAWVGLPGDMTEDDMRCIGLNKRAASGGRKF